MDEQRRLLLGDVGAAPRPRAAAPEAPRRPRNLLLRAARRLHDHGTRVAALDRALDDARAVFLGYIDNIARFERRRLRRTGRAVVVALARRRVAVVRAAAPLEVVAPLARVGQRRVRRPVQGSVLLLEVDGGAAAVVFL